MDLYKRLLNRMRDFDYFEPKTVEEAISLLDKYGGDAKALAGGTDLIVMMQNKKIRPKCLVNIKHIPNLSYISYDAKQGVRIGSLTTLREIEKSAQIEKGHKILQQVAHKMASPSVRNLATIGGNLCNASPAADMAPSLICLKAKAKVAGPKGERLIEMENFFSGPGKTALQNNELLLEIQVPPLPPRTTAVYLRHGKRGAAEVATVAIAVVITLEPSGEKCKEVRIAMGSAAPTPSRVPEAEKMLIGKVIDETLIGKAAQVVSEAARPITDVHSSAQYRKEMVELFTKRALGLAINQLKSGE